MGKRMSKKEILRSFDDAIKDSHIHPHYQPQYNHATGRMVGAEALMRWTHPEFGVQYPNDFIPVLEDSGFIVDADLCMIEQICRFQRACIDQHLSAVPISFNVSRVDILDEGFIDKIEEMRERFDVPVRLLRAEITETSAMGGLEPVSAAMHRLQDLGFVVEMDDFGSGYSSLNVLKDLPFDIIKLDMRFMEGDLSGRGGTILNAMAQMAKWLGTATIAEGVETLAQADYLKSIGCAYVQGYLYAWEYTIGTKEMRPCFRCMRDLGLPALVRNYPEPAIDAGIFPPDYADMYRDWHRQLEEGVESLEAIIPLTVARVPFHVRYTTEFDESGRPLKAYGSATLVVDEE